MPDIGECIYAPIPGAKCNKSKQNLSKAVIMTADGEHFPPSSGDDMETIAKYILGTGLDVQFWAWVVVGSVIFGAVFNIALNVYRAIEPAKSARLFIAEMLDLIPEETVREDNKRAYKEWAAQADKENGQLRERLTRAWRQKDEQESQVFHYQTRVEELTEKNARLEVAIRSWKSMIERSGVQ